MTAEISNFCLHSIFYVMIGTTKSHILNVEDIVIPTFHVRNAHKCVHASALHEHMLHGLLKKSELYDVYELGIFCVIFVFCMTAVI